MLRAILTCLALLAHGSPAPGRELPSVGTVPFILDDNRVFAELAFVRPDGTLRKALAFVDLGTPALVLNESLRKELLIDPGRPLAFRIGALELRVPSSSVETETGSPRTGPNGRATIPVEAVLPGSALTDYQVIFDYGRRSLTIARPDTLRPEGDAVPCRVNERTGLVSLSAVIAGQTYAMAVDPGSAYSWVREDVARQWVETRADWKRGTGAVGESNMQTRPDGAEARATILRIPEIRLGSLQLRQIGALGIAPAAPPFPPVPGEPAVQGGFFDWYSKKAPEPVIGWLGGNVLKGFRVMVDFPRHMTYWARASSLDPHDLDQVGVTLERRDKEEGYFIAGIAEKDGAQTVEGIRIGDKLIQVGDLRLAGATRGAIFSALHGKAGTVRVLILEREGRQVTVRAKTTAF
ncbi:MAG TPA: PDZ domain-containing protein [Vicinamibacterales bacterium]|nr:PDZ domain-containing protein [Vicinamibacterales bacterium]